MRRNGRLEEPFTQRPDKSSTIYVFFQVKEFEFRTVGLSVTIFKVSKHGIIRAFANTSDSFLVIIRFLSVLFWRRKWLRYDEEATYEQKVGLDGFVKNVCI